MLAPFLFIHAHGTGVSFEIKEEEYLIDIGYDAPIIEAGAPIRFDFSVITQEDLKPQTFNNIWIRIEETKELGQTIFATGISKPSFGLPTMIFTFPKEGEYTLYARFEDAGGAKIVEVKTPIFVEKSTGNQTPKNRWWLFVLTTFIGFVVGMFIPKLLKKN
ncbi:MAG: hypothetical protein Q8R36_02455 [bacterium]|nr:hypothetical protein [bacterium]